MAWWEYEAPSKFSVPERQSDSRVGAAVVLLMLAVVAFLTMLVSILFRGWMVFWIALVTMTICSLAGPLVMGKDKPQR